MTEGGRQLYDNPYPYAAKPHGLGITPFGWTLLTRGEAEDIIIQGFERSTKEAT